MSTPSTDDDRPVRVKICGVTRREDAMHAATAGADYLGLNFWPASKRHVDVSSARELAIAAREARPAIELVGVFVDADQATIALAVAAVGLDVVQLHGHEPAALTTALVARGLTVWRSAAMRGPDDVPALTGQGAHAFLLDTPTVGHGGSGRTFDWALAAAAVAAGHRIVLAGGLTADNVGAAVAQVRPWAVDVASGVESSPGKKDPARVTRFIAAARAADRGSSATRMDAP